jgi:predicted transcriptional regulator
MDTTEQIPALKDLVKGIKIHDMLMHDYTTFQSSMPLHEAASMLINNHQASNFIVMDKAVPVGIINRLDIIKSMAEKKYNTTVGELMNKDVECMDGEKEVDSVIERLCSEKKKLFPVMEHQHFSGLLNLQHVIEYLLLHCAGTGDYKKAISLTKVLE